MTKPGKDETLLKNVDIFNSLNDIELEEVAKFSALIKDKQDEILFSQGEQAKALYIVNSGEVMVQKIEDDQPVLIARFIQGNSFGELDLFSGVKRKVQALALKNSELLCFPKDGVNFKEFLEDHPAISAQVLHNILVVISKRIRRANELVKENTPMVQELKKQVYRDKLTGIYNQSYLQETLESYIHQGITPFALLISKPDNFKELNDNYGHEAGDRAIIAMAKGLRDFIGTDSNIARYKGNAMAIILPGTERKEAYQKAEELQSYINQLDLSDLTGSHPFHFSASVGIGLYSDTEMEAIPFIEQVHELPLIGRERGGNKILFLDGENL
jgi:diguanylate cyclase (GGDEF)-like protein